jgi:hypothetical protein
MFVIHSFCFCFWGHTDLVQHKINTGSAVPIRQSLRRLSYGRRQTEKEEILRMLDLGDDWTLHLVDLRDNASALLCCLPGDVNASFSLIKACSHSSFHWNQIKKEKPNWNQVSTENISVKTLGRKYERLKLSNGMLYREWIDVTEKNLEWNSRF